jgi:signal recognition particle subunit SEC65
MNRIIRAVIEEINEQLTPDLLTTILVEMTADIINGRFPGDNVSMSMTAEEFNEVGAVWRHAELWDSFYQETCAKYVQFKFGDVIAAAIESAEDILEIAKSSKDVVEKAGHMTKTILTVRYPDQPFNEKAAQVLCDRNRAHLDELLSMVRKVAEEVRAEREHPTPDVERELESAMVYQFPGPTTMQ